MSRLLMLTSRFRKFRNPSLAAMLIVLIAGFCGASAAWAGGGGPPAPSLSIVFTPNTIGPGGVSTMTYTITSRTGAITQDIAFTNLLPAGITIADPALASTTCDSGVVSAPDGGSTISLSDARLAPFQSCTVTVDVTSSTLGANTNLAVTVFSDQGSDVSLEVVLTVVSTLPGFSKSFAPSSVSLGGRSTLTFTIDNTANAARVGNLDFIDNLPAGMVVADPSNASTDCISASAPNTTITAVPGSSVVVLNADGSALFPGFEVLPEGAVCTVTVDVTAVGVGSLHNVTNDLLADFTNAGKASATLEVTVTPLALQKTFLDNPTPPGSTTTLEFRIANFDRLEAATGVAFTDDLDAALSGLTYDSLLSNDCGGTVGGVGTSLISFSGGTLAAEASCTIQVAVSVPAGAAPGGYTNTTSTISAMIGGSPTVGDAASETLFVEPVPVLTKEYLEFGTLSPDPIVNQGDQVVLRYTVTNTSTTSGATDLTFLDELTPSGPDPGFLSFPVAASLPTDPCGAGSTVALLVPETDRHVLSLTAGSLTAAPGAGSSCTFDVTLTMPSDIAPGTYSDATQEVTATVDGAARIGDSASDSLTVIAAPILSKLFLDPVGPGDSTTLEFTLEYPAEASGEATDIAFTDDLATVLAGLTATVPPIPDPPCGAGSSLTASAGDTLLTFMGGSLMPGETCTFSVTVDVPEVAAPGNYPNTTSGVSANVGGLPTVSRPATDVLNVSGLIFTKEFLVNPVLPGGTTTVRYTVENIHPTDDATGAFFTDNLNGALTGLAAVQPPTSDTCGGTPSGTTFLIYVGGAVTSGSTCTIEFDVSVPGGAADGDYGSPTSNLTATQGGAVVVDPAADVLTVNSTLLELTKTFTDDPVVPGDSVTMELVLTNLDTQSASSIAFTDDLDAALEDLTFDSVLFDDCGGTVTGTGTTLLDVSGVSLAGSGTCTLRVSLSVPNDAEAGAYLNTTSDLTGVIGGLAVSGEPASDHLDVVQLLDFSKAFDGPTTATGTATLTFTITNPGAAAASGLSFFDDLNDVIPGLVALSLPSEPCGSGSIMSGVSLLSFSGGSLPPMGGTCSFDVVVQVPAGVSAGLYPNTTGELFQNGLFVADPATADLEIEPPPTFAKAFSPDIVGVGQSSTLTFTIDNADSVVAANDLAFTDNLPTGVVVANPANASSTCGGTVTAIVGTAVISLSGGTVGASTSCTVQVDTAAGTNGVFVNTTGDLTSTSGNSGTATDALTVEPPPGFSKDFSPDAVALGGTSTLTFTINNSTAVIPGANLAFTDTFPTGMIVATPSGASTTCAGGVVTAVAGSNSVSFSNGTVNAGASCTVSVDVVAQQTGSLVNLSGVLTSSLGNSGTATDTLTVDPAPDFSKHFSPDAISLGGSSTLTFTIDNSSAVSAATNLDFADTFPTGMIVATPSGASTTCVGGTVTAVAGSNAVSYSGGTVNAGASCTVSVNVIGQQTGALVNISGTLTSSLGDSGTATDTLTVDPPPGFSKEFAPDEVALGEVSILTFTIDNSLSANSATGLDFTDSLPAGTAVAAPANASTTCTGGAITATDGSGVVAYTGGTVAAGAVCVVKVDVVGTASGTFTNTSGSLTSSLGDSGTATDDLTVWAPPNFSKVFDPDVIGVDEISVLTFTIENVAGASADNLDFTDALPAGLVVATPSNASTTCTGGTLTADDGSGAINYSGGSVAASSTCTVSVDVTSAIDGVYDNLSGSLTSSLGDSGTASDSLTVSQRPTFAKVFDPDLILAGEVSTLTFTIDHSAGIADATDVDFVDNLPTDVNVATPSNASTDCTGGMLVAAPGTGLISYTGGAVTAGAVCTITVDVTGDEDGTFVNLTGDLTSNLGNSGTATDELTVDGTPPTVTLINTSVDTGDGELEECEEVRVGVSEILITFSESVQDPIGDSEPGDVTNLESYLLVSAGPDRDFDTTSCGGAMGDDVEIAVGGATYDDGTLTATLDLGASLDDSLYRLFVCGTILDAAGNELDGDGNGTGGDDLALTYRVDRTNLLTNGHFDCSIDDWVTVSTIPEEIEYSMEDIDESLVSGSAEVTNLSMSNDFSIGQCAPVGSDLSCTLASSVRLDAEAGVLLTAASICEYFASPDCSGEPIGIDTNVAFLLDTGGLWQPLEVSGRNPVGSASALCSVDLRTGDGDDFNAYLDDVTLTCGDPTIFADGFESGDTSAWTLAVP